MAQYANSNEQQQQQNQQGQDGTPSHQSLSAMRVGGGGGNDQQERAASVNSSQSLQDSQLQFYDAIEYFTSDSESDDDSDQDSDGDVNETTSAAIKSAKLAIVPGNLPHTHTHTCMPRDASSFLPYIHICITHVDCRRLLSFAPLSISIYINYIIFLSFLYSSDFISATQQRQQKIL